MSLKNKLGYVAGLAVIAYLASGCSFPQTAKNSEILASRIATNQVGVGASYGSTTNDRQRKTDSIFSWLVESADDIYSFIKYLNKN